MRLWTKNAGAFLGLGGLVAGALALGGAFTPAAVVSAPNTASSASDAATHPRLIVLGVDGMDPDILRDVIARFPERTPNLRWLAEQSGIHELGTSQPPQSPVAWSNFITGRDPGGHGIYDFLHRDPVTRAVIGSTTVTTPTGFFGLTGGDVESTRSGRAFWKVLADHGVPADIWRMPINYPVEASNGVSFPGMMTPAVDSAYGEASFFTTDAFASDRISYKKLDAGLTERGGVIDAELKGPSIGGEASSAPLTVYIDREATDPRTGEVTGAAAFELGLRTLVLQPGEWSDFVPVDFGGIGGVVRFYLRQLEPHVAFYASPVNIDPSNPIYDVSAPKSASADLAEAIGTYYTQGMAEDVNALKNEIITDDEFLAQSDLVYTERRRMMDHAFERYLDKEEGGLLFFYYSTVDLMCHMLWRHSDADHPFHDAAMAGDDTAWWSGREGSAWKDVVHDIYLKVEPVIEDIRTRMDASGEPWELIVMSDHGFAPYSRKFSLNTWLYDNGYLVLSAGMDKEARSGTPPNRRVPLAEQVTLSMPGVTDWSKTRAYGMGFNGLYLNLAGREGVAAHGEDGEPGIVTAGERRALLEKLKAELEAIVDPATGKKVVRRADIAEDFYANKERLADAPDILVGYEFGYGNSDESSLGRVTSAGRGDGADWIENNTGGTFNGSHLMSPDVVGGILMSTKKVREGQHGLADLTVEVLAHYGVEPLEGMHGHRVLED
ncbi:Type I phosphodiesterase / nucleotide pyrophosphatase [Planctomycetes bacterium Pla163]|uniref:Type I phosphodiesterase / nucleotide pyrophosphatase n=1 Tax=Rohdeia mirabilis TaxID=2528008 RepID=A0A518D3N1_9BACT|nr:Type I phosphodiesterase / nucleotide pyrophosphatase [Planctomycetes bacterium Pla163]